MGRNRYGQILIRRPVLPLGGRIQPLRGKPRERVAGKWRTEREAGDGAENIFSELYN